MLGIYNDVDCEDDYYSWSYRCSVNYSEKYHCYFQKIMEKNKPILGIIEDPSDYIQEL